MLESEPDTTVLDIHSEDDKQDHFGGEEQAGPADAASSTDGAGGTDGPADAGSGSGTAVVVDGSGAVVDTAHLDPQTGQWQSDHADTTVVQEPPTDLSSGGLPHDGATIIDLPDDTSKDGGAQPDATPGRIDPGAFRFRPESDNWQSTRCTEIRFAYGSLYSPPQIVRVGVVVGAPMRLRDGKPLFEREAQLEAATAAQAAAGVITVALNAGDMIASEVQPRFVAMMAATMAATGIGYRVSGCAP